jgi:hypothetical protein
LGQDVASTNQGNLYDAIYQLRPEWLTRTVAQRRGDDAIAAYVDEQYIGPVSTLKRIPTFNIKRVRYLSASEAQNRYGQTNALRAAIAVEQERP